MANMYVTGQFRRAHKVSSDKLAFLINAYTKVYVHYYIRLYNVAKVVYSDTSLSPQKWVLVADVNASLSVAGNSVAC